MNDFIILYRFYTGSSILQIAKDYSKKMKCSTKQAREVVETIIYCSYLRKKGV